MAPPADTSFNLLLANAVLVVHASIAAFVSTSSTIASTIRSAPSTSAGLVVTRTCDASPPSTFVQSFSTSSSARQAEVSLRARTKIYYDAANMRVTNNANANQYLTREYRAPYKL